MTILLSGCVSSENPSSISEQSIGQDVMLSKSLSGLFGQSDLSSQWLVNDSWGNYVYSFRISGPSNCTNFGVAKDEICNDSFIGSTNVSDYQNAYETGVKKRNISNEFTSYSFSVGKSPKWLSIGFRQWNSVDAAINDYSSLLAGLQTDTYTEKQEIVPLGNDCVGASRFAKYTIVFRRNNVVVRLENTAGSSASDRQELQDYGRLTDERLIALGNS